MGKSPVCSTTALQIEAALQTVVLKPLAKKVVKGEEITNHFEKILSGHIPCSIA